MEIHRNGKKAANQNNNIRHFTCHKHCPKNAPTMLIWLNLGVATEGIYMEGPFWIIQFTITIIFPSRRLWRIKIAAVSSKSQKLQQQHQFSTRQRIFRHQSGKYYHSYTYVWVCVCVWPLTHTHTDTHTHTTVTQTQLRKTCERNFHVQTLLFQKATNKRSK